MIPDTALGILQADIFNDPATGHWDNVFGGLTGKVGHIVIDGVSVVCWPGSKYGMDWIENIEAIPLDIPALGIGTVHTGMIANVLANKARLDAVVKPRFIVSGHSLGAAHALLYGAWMTALGHPPEYILALAPPRCSYQEMWNVLDKAKVSYKCCWNGGDEVPDLPPTIPLVLWTPSPVFTRFSVAPDPTDTGRFRYHHLALYRQGIASAMNH